uniref:SWIM-type domain-containing protein n=1 Tax=Dulem virus 38 TaxID=3145756 RepID=A0AAU8B2E0_9CAUD
MTDAQLAKARETWRKGEAVQTEENPRVWKVRSYSQAGGKRHHFVTLKSDHGYPRFTCTCPHGTKTRWASCWHARIVARIYRIMVEQMKRIEKEERINAYRYRGNR